MELTEPSTQGRKENLAQRNRVRPLQGRSLVESGSVFEPQQWQEKVGKRSKALTLVATMLK